MPNTPTTMRAAAIDGFGGPQVLATHTVPVPEPGPGEVLIRLHTAGVGVWDRLIREGKMAEGAPHFPLVLGADGAGTVAAVGDGVDRFAPGDQVYAFAFQNPKGGLYAEYAAVAADGVGRVPAGLSLEQAGAMPVDAVTALCGLDALGAGAGEMLAIVGASGGVGHLAVQLAKRQGARVLAVASGPDGVGLAERLGADAAVDGRGGDVGAAARAFAPGGLDAVLATTGGAVLEPVLAALRDGGRAAYPHGVQPEPRARPGVRVTGYDGRPNRAVIERLNGPIAAGPFDVHVARTFPLDAAAEAHRALDGHYLGKLALAVGAPA